MSTVAQPDYWNAFFGKRGPSLLQPEGFLVGHQELLHPGTVLDVASGDGRNAIYLASRGHQVTGVDFSSEGLRRLRQFAHWEGLSVETHEIDLNHSGRLLALGNFQNIVTIHFRPSIELFRKLCGALMPQGTFLLTAFNRRQHEERACAPELCYHPGEFLGVCDALELVDYRSYEDSRGYLDGYVFRKRSAAVAREQTIRGKKSVVQSASGAV